MMRGELIRYILISIISTIIVVGNIFIASWTWSHNPIWVSILFTIIALNSIFAWIVAIACFTEE